MNKLIVKFSNHPSPLEPIIILNEPIEKEIYVDDIHDINNILDKIEKLVEAIDDHDKGTISIEVSNKSWGTILRGNVKNGLFSGVTSS
ncbi:MAG: hypothetical protein PHH83_02175 [Patescibacteria group bacterium]|nr:hypothetical protein [Patescibacteria group bacterium]